MVHEVREAKLLPHVLVCEKSPALAPVNPTLEMLSAVNSLLYRVKFCGLPGAPMATLPRLTEVGASSTSTTPVPLNDEVSVWY